MRGEGFKPLFKPTIQFAIHDTGAVYVLRDGSDEIKYLDEEGIIDFEHWYRLQRLYTICEDEEY